MCLICVEYELGKLTRREALNNLSEMQEAIDEDHLEEVIDLLGEEVDEDDVEND